MKILKIIILILFSVSQSFSQAFEINFIKKYKIAYDSLMNIHNIQVNLFLDSISKTTGITKNELKIKHIPLISYNENIQYPVDTSKFIYYLNPNKIKFLFSCVYNYNNVLAIIDDNYNYWGKSKLRFYYTNNYFFDLLNYLDENQIDTVFIVEATMYLFFAIKNCRLFVISEYKVNDDNFEYSINSLDDFFLYKLLYKKNNRYFFSTFQPSSYFSEKPPEKSKIRKIINKIKWFIYSFFYKCNC